MKSFQFALLIAVICTANSAALPRAKDALKSFTESAPDSGIVFKSKIKKFPKKYEPTTSKPVVASGVKRIKESDTLETPTEFETETSSEMPRFFGPIFREDVPLEVFNRSASTVLNRPQTEPQIYFKQYGHYDEDPSSFIYTDEAAHTMDSETGHLGLTKQEEDLIRSIVPLYTE